MIIDYNLAIDLDDVLPVFTYIRDAGGRARLIGGAVRDALLGVKPFDIDIVTDLIPDDVVNILSKHRALKIRFIDKNYGKVTIEISGKLFEIGTLREDISCSGRHAKVSFTKSFESDSFRRDFTINALSYCPFSKHMYDYHNGFSHIKNSEVVFIGNAEDRIKEDYLRILRFFRFSSRYAKEINQDGLAACIKFKDQIATLSKERIKSEMDRLLSRDNISSIIELIYSKSILREIFPIIKIDSSQFTRLDIISANFGIKAAITTKYAILFSKTEFSKDIFLDLKFSNKESAAIVSLLSMNKLIDNSNKLKLELKKKWLNNKDYGQYFLYIETICSESIFDLYTELSVIQKPIFPINGNDLIMFGIKSKEIGYWIKKLHEIWIESDFLLSKDELLSLCIHP